MSDLLPTSGLHPDIDENLYHADPLSLSSSSAKTLIYDGPAEFKRKQEEEPAAYNPAFAFGSVVHALVLGVGEYEVLDFPDWRTKASKAARDELGAKGIAPILPRDMEKAELMRDSVLNHPVAAELLSQGQPEVSMWATDPATGVLMRGRVDWLNQANVDLKTSGREVDQRNFLDTVWSFRYAFQAAWYERIMALNGVFGWPARWVAVSKRPPHNAGVFAPDPMLMAHAREDVKRALHLYAYCLEHDEWPELAFCYSIPGVGAPAIASTIPWAESVYEC